VEAALYRMEIWGLTQIRFKTLGHGTFFCPSCGGDRQYSRRKGRRWLLFAYIPVIPLGYIGDEFVHCDTCHREYGISILENLTLAAFDDHLVSAYREAVVWLVRRRTVGPSTRRAALEVLSSAAGREWAEAELEADIAELDVGRLTDRLATLSVPLTHEGKEEFLARCTRVAVADGQLADEERDRLEHLATSLGMTPAHARGAIEQTVDQAGR
jgi:tellurite resistance protein